MGGPYVKEKSGVPSKHDSTEGALVRRCPGIEAITYKLARIVAEQNLKNTPPSVKLEANDKPPVSGFCL
jgi:hypothetical protein